jgi:hypothetical protein
MGLSAGLAFALTGIGSAIGIIVAMVALDPKYMSIAYLLLCVSLLLIVIGVGGMAWGIGRRGKKRTPGVVVQTSGPNSPGIVGDHNQLTINPDVNPNAPVVTYDFNGTKREVSYALGYAVDISNKTPQNDAFRAMEKVQHDEQWQLLREISEQEMKKTPEWLTPYLFAAVASAQLGEIEKAIQLLDYVREKAAGRLDYAQAEKLRAEIRKHYGK